jgi:pimeloyl-ACP methyl ester carboxylesterase
MITYKKQGSGPALLLIHGFCESKEMWETFSNELSTSHTVYCPDLPGFGESSLNGTHVSLEETALFLQEWRAEKEIQNPTVIGHSLGGYVTLALAELMGSGLKAIGLFHSTAFADDEEKKSTRNKTISFIQKHGVDKFVEAFIPPLFSEQHRGEQVAQIEALTQLGKRSTKNGLVAFTAAMRDRKDRFDLWKTFPGPKLMIAGELDGAVKIEASRRHQPFASHYHELLGTGHMGMFEEKEKTLRMIREFLEDIS